MCDFEDAVVSTRVAVLHPVLLSVFFFHYLLSPGLCAFPLPSLGMTCTNLRVVFKVQFEHFLCVAFPGHWLQVSPFRWERFRGRDRESPVGRTSPLVSFVPTSPSIARGYTEGPLRRWWDEGTLLRVTCRSQALSSICGRMLLASVRSSREELLALVPYLLRSFVSASCASVQPSQLESQSLESKTPLICPYLSSEPYPWPRVTQERSW